MYVLSVGHLREFNTNHVHIINISIHYHLEANDDILSLSTVVLNSRDWYEIV